MNECVNLRTMSFNKNTIERIIIPSFISKLGSP
jgi:hypothetical protein